MRPFVALRSWSLSAWCSMAGLAPCGTRTGGSGGSSWLGAPFWVSGGWSARLSKSGWAMLFTSAVSAGTSCRSSVASMVGFTPLSPVARGSGAQCAKRFGSSPLWSVSVRCSWTRPTPTRAMWETLRVRVSLSCRLEALRPSSERSSRNASGGAFLRSGRSRRASPSTRSSQPSRASARLG